VQNLPIRIIFVVETIQHITLAQLQGRISTALAEALPLPVWVSAEVADMQQDLLVDLCGYVKGDATDRTFAPATYSPVYAEIALVFNAGNGKYVAAVLPKVLLNSKATFDSLSTSMGRITLAGTAQNIQVSDGSGVKNTPFYIDSNWTTAEL
jgi:hypothetical protein